MRRGFPRHVDSILNLARVYMLKGGGLDIEKWRIAYCAPRLDVRSIFGMLRASFVLFSRPVESKCCSGLCP